ncbi:hypothetical protein JVT61DRAFT_3291 [Boletus reticuloceps]|uniref:Uncharacterized protein n=1 Tax=Boletus reticuloceps TaxID=495285 RepID=A0A8I2YP15_9AGAM|nr:hypothetical protein JVT61DRAFT_3291 [Boletus reticuloceps]
MDALRNPHKPRPIGGEVARHNPKSGSSRPSFVEYLEAVVEQDIDRSGHRIRDIKGYLEIRRETIGAKAPFALLELALDIPDEVNGDVFGTYQHDLYRKR